MGSAASLRNPFKYDGTTSRRAPIVAPPREEQSTILIICLELGGIPLQRLATRHQFDKLAETYSATISLAAIVTW